MLWPIEQGLIDSFARPGRNATGVASYAGIEITTKRLEYLRQIALEAKRLAWVWPASLYSLETVAGGTVDMRPMVESAAKGLGFEIRFHTVGQAQSIDALFEEIMTGRAQALSAGAGAFMKRASALPNWRWSIGLPAHSFPDRASRRVACCPIRRRPRKTRSRSTVWPITSTAFCAAQSQPTCQWDYRAATNWC